MRLSVDKRDKGYRFNFDTKKAFVYLDGQLFTRAVTADEEESLVVAMKLDPAGAPLVRLGDNGQPEGFELEVLHGKVRIEVIGDDGKSLRCPKVSVERNAATNEIHVYAYSRIRAKNIRRMRLSTEKVSSLDEKGLIQACGLAAGAAAEYLCDNYGDIFDPSEAATAGMEACQQMLANEAQLTRH